LEVARREDRVKEPEVMRFPLGIASAGIVATGLGLVVSAMGVQWGASPPAPDALQMSWVYVNVALVWTWLLAWPALGLKRPQGGRLVLAWDFAALLVAAIPAMGIAAFLSGVNERMAWMATALQLAVGIFAMGAMAWRRFAGAGFVAGLLTAVGAALPVMGYAWAEFFPAASQAWRAFIPAVAAARIAGGELESPFWWVIGAYALLGFGLWGTAPREE
jgi:hypothetical protein